MGKHQLVVGLIVVAFTCAACAAPAQTEVDDQVHTVASWAATAHAAAIAWQQAQVPDAYARQTLEAAQDGLAEANDAVATLAASDQREGLRAQIERFTALVQALHTAVEQHDRPAAANKIAALESEQQRLAALTNGARTQP